MTLADSPASVLAWDKPIPEIPLDYLQTPVRGGKVSFVGLARYGNGVYLDLFRRESPKVPMWDVLPEMQRSCGWQDIPETQHQYDIEEGSKKAAETQIACKHPVMVPDPECIWVGRFLDGLVFCQVFFDTRARAKSFLDYIPPDLGTGQSGLSAEAGIMMRPIIRPEMIRSAEAGRLRPEALNSQVLGGKTPSMALGPLMKEIEPGSVVNSPYSPHTPLVQATVDEDDIYSEQIDVPEWTPAIRRDGLLGLHYLMRGDIVRVSGRGWPRPRQDHFEAEYHLRPPNEGPSLVEQDMGGSEIIDLI